MTIGNLTINPGDLIPAWFIGSPVALIGAGALHYVMPVGWALLAGAVIGLACGFALVHAMRRG